MAKERRILRLQQLILELAAEAIQRDIRDPRIGVVSVTRVKLSSDLSRARIYWSVLGGEPTQRTTERGLHHALPVIQRAVAHGLGTRITPRLALQFDETLEKTNRLEEIFHSIHIENRTRGMEEEEPEQETTDDTDDIESADEPDDADSADEADSPNDTDSPDESPAADDAPTV